MFTSQSSLRISHYFYGATLLAVSLSLSNALGTPISGLVIAACTMCVWWRIFADQKLYLQLHKQATCGSTNRASTESTQQVSKPAFYSALTLIATPTEWAGILFVVGVTVGLLLTPSLNSKRIAATTRNLKSVAKALLEYEHSHGCFPPPVTYDANGQPMHSWRVLLLPHLGEQETFARYRLTEPWNSAHNSRLANYCPKQFQSYTAADAYSVCKPVGRLGVFAVSADGMDWLRDGRGRAIVVADSQRSELNWLEPSIVTAEQLEFDGHLSSLTICSRGFFATDYMNLAGLTDTNAVPKRVVHFTNLLRLSSFFLVVFYPVRWLHQLRLRFRD